MCRAGSGRATRTSLRSHHVGRRAAGPTSQRSRVTNEERGLDDEARALVASLDWYHTIDLGGGLVTPGAYDHRPYLSYYRLPDNLSGCRALDIGAASGFFTFELARRGAEVVATDLPHWNAHDFGPTYTPDQTPEAAERYLRAPFEVARRLHPLGSRVERRLINVYDINPATVGTFDLVFCGSLLIHLTDPIRALWNIASVTRGVAIIATVIISEHANEPLALLTGQNHGDTWWAPTRAALETMAALAGFAAVEWVSDFQLDYADGAPGPRHGVLHAFADPALAGPNALPRDAILTHHPASVDRVAALSADLREREQRVRELEALVRGYDASRVMRALKWLGGWRQRP